MINLSYNDSKSILHDLNPHYAVTHEWTKEYFNIDKDIQIDYSDFDMEYFLEEEDDNDWLNLEKNLENIIKNFIVYLQQQHKILFSESCIRIIRQGNQVVPKDFLSLKKNTYTLSFKINVTDLILLALELDKFPPVEISNDDFEMAVSHASASKGVFQSETNLPEFGKLQSEKPPLHSPVDMKINTPRELGSFKVDPSFSQENCEETSSKLIILNSF